MESSVEVYSVKNDTWTTAPSLNQARIEHSSCCLKDYVYVSCGRNGYDPLNSIERVDMRAFISGDKV